jgi:hypothetical protein
VVLKDQPDPCTIALIEDCPEDFATPSVKNGVAGELAGRCDQHRFPNYCKIQRVGDLAHDLSASHNIVAAPKRYGSGGAGRQIEMPFHKVMLKI